MKKRKNQDKYDKTSSEDSFQNNGTKTPSSKQESTYDAKKLKNAAISWFVSALLVAVCFYESRIIPMLILTPILLILGIGYYYESKKTLVKLTSDSLVINSLQAFKPVLIDFSLNSINKVELDVSGEGKNRNIHNITLKTSEGITVLPEIDQKEEFLKDLGGRCPKILIVEV